MKNIRLIVLLFSMYFHVCVSAQARLEVVNNSERSLFVKIMEKGGGLFAKMSVAPYSSETQYFDETGYYYLKTKGSKKGLRPVFKKGNAFKVHNGTDGYSVLTITYSISGGVSSDGREISEDEFNRN